MPFFHSLIFVVPPKFDDLGKEARDLFGKEFGKEILHLSDICIVC